MAPRFASLNNGTQARVASIVLVNQVIVLRAYENCVIIEKLKQCSLMLKNYVAYNIIKYACKR
jgi:hypothetical protein